jgi:predicted transposase YbfD/YdcC
LACFISWVNEVRGEQGHEHIAIDGKTLRRSFHKSRRCDALHMLSVWVSGSELFFSGAKSKGKKNEVETVLELIELLEVKGVVITLDAMSTQRAVAAKIHHKQGDYILALKGNQGNLHKEVKAHFHKCHRDKEVLEHHHYRDVDSRHGRIEERHYIQLPVTDWIEQAPRWAGLQSVIEVTRTRHIDDQTTTETQYYISSLAPDVKACAKHIRQHWGVENKVHWVLDMTFREDESRIRRGDGAEIMAMIRRFCMNLTRLHSTKDSVRGKLKRLSWSDSFREAVLFS